MAKKKLYRVIIGEDEYPDLKDPDVEHALLDRESGGQKVTIVKDDETKIAEYSGHLDFKIVIME